MKRLHLALALAAAASVAAGCGGGGAAGSGAQTVVPVPNGPGNLTPSTVTMTIAIPAPPKNPTLRHGNYVSPGTQSIGVVVTNQGASPSPAQFTNVSSCPVVNNVTTCTISVSALPGNDAFTVNAYSSANGGGSLLSTGSVSSTIQAGVANVTMPLTMGGVIASISLVPALAPLPLGQSTSLNVVAKDASGATIVGTYDNPITLSAPSAVALTRTSVASSGDGAKVTVAWSYGFSGPSAQTISASGDGVNGSLALSPGTGFAFYAAGSSSGDATGFKTFMGPDGNVYFSSLSIVACTTPNGLCTATAGAVHQLNTTTGVASEIPVNFEPVGLYFDQNNTLWIAGGPQGVIGYLPNATTSFAGGTVQTVPLPTPSPAANVNVRSITSDGTNLFFVDRSGHRLLKMPIASPSTANITAYTLPKFTYKGNGMVAYYNNGSVYIPDQANGVVDVFATSTSSFGTSVVLPGQASLASNDSVSPYDAAGTGSSFYVGTLGSFYAGISNGNMDLVNLTNNTASTIALPSTVGFSNIGVGANGTNVYYGDGLNNGLGYINASTGKSRLYPVSMNGVAIPTFPNGEAVANDGTAWFSCYNSNVNPLPPLCAGHTVYLNNWTVWPSTSISIYGSGTQNQQVIGMMEAPASDSGPFTATSSNTSVCTVANLNDHNFNIVGVAAGSCSVVVTDAHNVSQTISVTVTTTNGTIQGRAKNNQGAI